MKAVLFDMDGVLIDSQPLHFLVDRLVLKHCGHEATLQDVLPHTGTSNPDRWPKYKRIFNLAQSVDELIALQTHILMDVFRKENLVAIPGIMELLQLLSAANIPLAVASSSSIELITLVLEKIHAAVYFQTIVSGEEVKNGKPAPDVFLLAAKKMCVSPVDCVVIEDSANGVAAALRANMICVGYMNPNSGKQDLSPAHIVIDNFYTITDLSFFEELRTHG